MNLSTLLTEVFIVTLCCSCGLPDTLLTLEAPSVSSLTNTDTLSGQYNGADLSQYGIVIFYKVYTENTAASLFDQDVSAWSSRITEDQVQVSNSLKFKYITLSDRSSTSKDVLPLVELNKSGDWKIEFEAILNLSSSEPTMKLVRDGGTDTVSVARIVQRYNFEHFNQPSDYTFGSGADVDLQGLSVGSGSIYVGFVAEMYGFAPLGGNVYSKPAKLRIVRVQ